MMCVICHNAEHDIWLNFIHYNDISITIHEYLDDKLLFLRVFRDSCVRNKVNFRRRKTHKIC